MTIRLKYILLISFFLFYVQNTIFAQLENDASNNYKTLSKTHNTFKISTNTWTGLTSPKGSVLTLLSVGSDIYAGGEFWTSTGGVANFVAKWNGSSWVGLNSGLNDYVYALATDGSYLYVGGSFTTAGPSNITVNHIARYNLSTGVWSAMGAGVNATVWAIAVSGSDIYVGGTFLTAGSPAINVNSVAKWNSTTGWSALGSGMDNSVLAMTTVGSDIFMGGSFGHANGITVNRVAKWNTLASTWSALGSPGNAGTNDIVYSLASDGTNLYVGGKFSAVSGGNLPAQSIAKWDGSAWSALNSFGKPGATVYTIAVSGTDVYVGGALFNTYGSPMENIQKWNGAAWSAIGGGTDNQAKALSIMPSEGAMYVGGRFAKVDGSITSNYFAKFTDSENPLPVELTSFSAAVSGKTVELNWETATEVNNYGFEIERASSSTMPVQDDWNKIGFVKGNGNSNSPNKYSFKDKPLGGTKYKFRLKQIDVDGAFTYSKILDVNLIINNFELTQNYPNPFNPTTKIKYQISKPGFVSLKVYDVLGKEVANLVKKNMVKGNYEVTFNAENLSSGIYIYTLKENNKSLSKKLLLLK